MVVGRVKPDIGAMFEALEKFERGDCIGCRHVVDPNWVIGWKDFLYLLEERAVE